MPTIHLVLAWTAVVIDGLVGLWGTWLGIVRRPPGRAFWVGVGVGSALMLIDVAVGVYLSSASSIDAGDQHVFYGIVVAFVFAFAYIYRAQLARRPALYYGLFFLFVMGLGLRAIVTFGHDF
ncbi:MAG: hypothetical protein WB239_12015 [Acidimicrobiia bacterium]